MAGAFGNIQIYPRFGAFNRDLRWSALSIETLAAPALLIPEISNPSALIKAHQYNISIAHVAGHA